MIARRNRIGIIALALVLLTTMLPLPAEAAPRAQKAIPSISMVTIDLAQGKTAQLGASVYPEGASQRVVWATKNKAIATVNSKGLVTAKKVGSVMIGVRPAGVKKYANIKLKVVDSLRPTSMTIPQSKVTLKLDETYQIIPTLTPEGTDQSVRYTSSKASVAKVSSAGLVTARKAGSAYITIRSRRNTGLAKRIKVTVAKPQVPKSITITPADKTMNLGDTLQLNSAVSPLTAYTGVKWSSSNTKIAKVTQSGLVTPVKAGTVKITVRSKVKSSIYRTRTIKVVDPYKPTKIRFNYDDALYYGKNSTDVLSYTIEPATARKDVKFTSSNTKYVSVDSDGRITCKEDGIVTITVQAVGTTLTAKVKVVVLNTKRTAVLPAKYSTSEGDIKENLAKIDAIRESAYGEILAMQGAGKFSAAEAQNRRNAVAAAFTSYGFAWNTDVNVGYWNSALKANNFLKGRIYYGMPYIQCGANGNYSNRQFNLTKAVSQGYFKAKSGMSRYYSMTSKRLSKFYVGCDCSSFVSMAIWGVNHSASYLNTGMIASSGYYKTVSGGTNMRPGDVMNKGGSHVVMFLYYLDNAKTQMMLIENSGGSVSCKTANVKTYLNNGYKIRRPTKY